MPLEFEQRTGLMVSGQGGYAAVMADTVGNRAAMAGDVLEITWQGLQDDKTGTEKVIRVTLADQDILSACIIVQP